MTGAVTVRDGGEDARIPLARLDLPEDFSDQELKRAVAQELDTHPTEFARHQVMRNGGDIVLHRHTESSDSRVVWFVVWGTLFLLVGTVQGVIQVMPEVRRWIFSTGAAGHMIDPLAHAHVNLVGGVVMIAIAAAYYILPRALGRPLFSMRMARLSLYGMAIGVSAWYLSMVTLGLIEGNMMLTQGIGFHEAKDAMQPWHTLGFVLPASIMGIGHWIFIANILLTVFKRPRG
ncbi:MAG: cbb3-type cytochrome c oxidase subunit I [Leptospirillia bacterium]